MEVLYVVNGALPNDKAHGVQIVHTAECLGKKCTLTLASRRDIHVEKTCGDWYGIAETFEHKTLWCMDRVGMPFRYAVRNVTFFISAFLYILLFFIQKRLQGKDVAVYVRGETILALIPLMSFIPIFFETHQIRNHAYIYRIALRLCIGIVVITDRLKRDFVSRYKLPPNKICVARDAVDLAQFSTVTSDKNIWRAYGISENATVVLYTGTLAPEKGADTLAEASVSAPHNTSFVFLGGTDTQIAQFKERYGTYEKVIIGGRVPYTEVARYLVSADILVLPDSGKYTYSNLYTSPMKLFEYMASGVPILASSVPSVREVLDDATAYFFEPDVPQSLCDGIVYIHAHITEAHIKARVAQAHVHAYTWERRAECIMQHITQSLTGVCKKF